MDRYIECKTQEQWNIVLNWIKIKLKKDIDNFGFIPQWINYGENSVVCIINKDSWGFCNKHFYKQEGITKFLSFEEFCKQEGINIDKTMTTQEEINKLKTRLQELEEKVKKENEFKVGDWIMETWPTSPYYNKTPFQITSINKNVITYSRSENVTALSKDLRKITLEEVKEYLISEANKKYPKGTKFKTAGGSGKIYISDGDAKNWTALGSTAIANPEEGLLYAYGEWAEIVKEATIEISGYKAEFNKANKTVSFGCKKDITKKDLEAILTVMELNKKFSYSFFIDYQTFGCEDHDIEVSKETIQKLIDKLEE